MIYDKRIVKAEFINRPNRFYSNVKLEGKEIKVHGAEIKVQKENNHYGVFEHISFDLWRCFDCGRCGCYCMESY